jgi:hypothetical protein
MGLNVSYTKEFILLFINSASIAQRLLDVIGEEDAFQDTTHPMMVSLAPPHYWKLAVEHALDRIYTVLKEMNSCSLTEDELAQYYKGLNAELVSLLPPSEFPILTFLTAHCACRSWDRSACDFTPAVDALSVRFGPSSHRSRLST